MHERIEQNVKAKLAAAGLLGNAGLDVHVSVDPTQIGYGLDGDIGRRNALRIAETVAQYGQVGRVYTPSCSTWKTTPLSTPPSAFMMPFVLRNCR